MTYFYNLHNIISLKSDIDMGLKYFQCAKAPEELDLIVSIVDYKSIDKEKYQKIAPGLYYSEAENSIVSNMSILGLKISWEVRNILSVGTELRVSKSYAVISKYILTFPISLVYELTVWIRMVIRIKMLLKGYSFIVGGCANLNGRNIIFTGGSGSGKTLATTSFINNYNVDFMSDDVFIINKNALYSYPSILKLRKLNFSIYSFAKYVDPIKKFKGKIINKTGKDCDVYFLELSNIQFLKKISTIEGINKLGNLTNRLFLCTSEKVLSFLPYTHGEFSFLQLFEKQQEIMSAFFKDTDFYIISAKNTSDYMELLKDKY